MLDDQTVSVVKEFTFHNISINSVWSLPTGFSIFHLHSTMFLLIQEHTVQQLSQSWHLHSTMFLLILLILSFYLLFIIFTFHNVSINSKSLAKPLCTASYLHSTMFLLIPWCNRQQGNRICIYIPQCFY